MKKLSKQQIEERGRRAEEVRLACDNLDTVIDAYNCLHEAVQNKVEAALDKANAAIQAANAFCEEIAQEQQSYYDDRSEKWQEGEAGSNYQTWMDTWQKVYKEAEIEFPASLETPDVNCANAIDDLPDCVD